MGGALSGVYRYRSGLPFTPMIAAGLDANGDGSAFNDPAFIPTSSALGEVGATWNCLSTGQGAFAVRNSCRGDPTHRIDLRLAFGLGRLPAQIVVDALNITDANEGVRDNALLVIDPAGTLTRSGSTVTVPYRVNPGFGTFLLRTDPGRMIRVGIRIGGGS